MWPCRPVDQRQGSEGACGTGAGGRPAGGGRTRRRVTGSTSGSASGSSRGSARLSVVASGLLVRALGSIASAVINARAFTTSSQIVASTLRTAVLPSGLRISSVPANAGSDAATRTRNRRACSSGAAWRKRVVRARSEPRNAAAVEQPAGAA